MHNWAKEIMECVKTKVKGKGLDNIEGRDLEELKTWACIAKDIAEYDYYYHITEAMENPEEEYGETYDEDGPMKRGYRRARDSRGRYMRRGYQIDESPRGYGDWSSIHDASEMMGRGYSSQMMSDRDMDKDSRNVMYYSGSADSNNASGAKYGNAMRGYEEAKDTKSLNKVFDVIESDIKEIKPHMTANDMATVRQRLTNMATMMV